jgi:hypothetical protein
MALGSFAPIGHTAPAYEHSSVTNALSANPQVQTHEIVVFRRATRKSIHSPFRLLMLRVGT